VAGKDFDHLAQYLAANLLDQSPSRPVPEQRRQIAAPEAVAFDELV
jgi:hypothetical protein